MQLQIQLRAAQCLQNPGKGCPVEPGEESSGRGVVAGGRHLGQNVLEGERSSLGIWP